MNTDISNTCEGPDPLTEEEEEYQAKLDKRFGVGVYRRVLPDCCIGYSTDVGRKIFREAIKTKYMNIHYKLMEQFRTQADPFLCGFATLTTVLNTLRVDPGRKWRLGWRWYDEYQVQTCVSMTKMTQKENGIDFDQFLCAARLNHLDVEAVRVTSQSSLKHFRSAILRSCKSSETILVCSYARPTMQQTGGGHFVPIGGYNKKRDLILLLDVARYKLPPHWVPVELMWQAMQEIDKSTGLPRGYAIFRKNMTNTKVHLLHRGHVFSQFDQAPLPDSTEVLLRSTEHFTSSWNKLLSEPVTNCNGSLNIDQNKSAQLAEKLILDFVEAHACAYHPCFQMEKLLTVNIVKTLKNTSIYRIVTQAFSKMMTSKTAEQLAHDLDCKQDESKKISFRSVMGEKVDWKSNIEKRLNNQSLLMTLFLLCFPYPEKEPDDDIETISQVINDFLQQERDSLEADIVTNWQCQFQFANKMLGHASHHATFPEVRGYLFQKS